MLLFPDALLVLDEGRAVPPCRKWPQMKAEVYNTY
jgi:hypothetical protein